MLSEVYRPRYCSLPVHHQEDDRVSTELRLPQIEAPNHDCTIILGAPPNTKDRTEVPLTDSFMALEVLRICGLISESRNTNLASHMLERNIQCVNISKFQSQESPESPAFLPTFWRFPLNVRCHKSTCGALHALSQRKFETMVVRLQGHGFDSCDPVRVSDSSIFQYTYYFIFHNTIYPEFDPHILTMVSAGDILENDTGLPHQLFFPSPISPKTSNPSFLKIPSAPTFSPTFRSPNSLWKESFPSATLPYANDFQIQVSVNAGHLIANSTSIRDAQTDTCILEYIGQRPEGERFYADRIILAEKAEIPTPIVEKSKRETFYVYRKGNKGVLFDKICTYLDVSGVLEYGEVVENEGKTDSIYGVWPKPLQRRVIIRKGWKYILET
ncbi:hypothetical protein HBI56_213170 [Parastagonospora nodorum]|nr:hypothetical protein HBH98_216150 [Parastagonospora nodorum]KAH4360548.1 hypothetical protein HBH97_205550 [Parastagonospora nodorum]KAH4376343.1 hypothetical protein HBH99_213680 [Parastagonospora nodorum]KAH4843410.1 hypothetical protein HBH75_202790 [Parastagonospora nodorum]KAH4894393.1 hypothetical protein HBH74_196710 [Parastagonospora nodorum]